MVIDKLEHFEKYVSLNPLFGVVAEYLKANDLLHMETGKHVIQGEDLYVNIVEAKPKSREEAKLEAHHEYIDVQLPLSDAEEMGYTPLADCHPQDAPYNAADDILFYEGAADSYITMKPGMFSILFPQDGHAPAITPRGLKKAIFKVKVC